MSEAKTGCQKPEDLKGSPGQCSPEQIRACRGDAAEHMCVDSGCEKPEELEGSPQECSPEQIRKCHGDDAGHPCVG